MDKFKKYIRKGKTTLLDVKMTYLEDEIIRIATIKGE